MDQDAEATHSYVRAAPGRVFARLARRTLDGTLVRGMHVEFTPAQAIQMARHLNECARIAIAADTPVPGKFSEIAKMLLGSPTKRRHSRPSP